MLFIMLKSPLHSYGFSNSDRIYGTSVNSSGYFVVIKPAVPKMTLQKGQWFFPQFFSCKNTESIHLFGGYFAYSVKFSDVKTIQKWNDFIGSYGSLPIGLLIIAGYFSNEFIDRHACRGSQSYFFKYFFPNFLGNVRSGGIIFLVKSHIQIRLIEGKRLYQIGVFIEYFADLQRNFLIPLKTRRNEDKFWAELPCFRAAHRTTNAIFPRFVACCRYHASIPCTAHSDGFSSKIRTVQLLYRSKESIHIDVDYLIFRGVHFLKENLFYSV